MVFGSWMGSSFVSSLYQPLLASLSGEISRLTRGRIRDTPMKSKAVPMRIRKNRRTKYRRSFFGKIIFSFVKRDFCSINGTPLRDRSILTHKGEKVNSSRGAGRKTLCRLEKIPFAGLTSGKNVV